MKYIGKLTIAEINELHWGLENDKYTLETQSSMIDVIVETDSPQIINRLIAKGMKKWNT